MTKFRRFLSIAFLVAITHSAASQTRPTADELASAIHKGDPDVVRSMLANGAPVGALSHDGFAPLANAVMLGASTRLRPQALEIVKLLVESGADIEQQGPRGNTPLTAAVGWSTPEIVEYLLIKGANPNSRGYGGTAALYQATRHKKAQITELLIRHGANVNAASEVGWTPLHLAVINGMESTVKLLIDSGANINSRDVEGKTPRSWAKGEISSSCLDCRSLATPSLIELLERSGARE
ncbi:MAG TPA: ankyrin repeat domain-containing protein [Noviherbaspirillum sp.]